MKIWSYCAYDWQHTTEVMSGVEPKLTPPHNHKSIDLEEAARADIVYLNLHGYARQPHFYGQMNDTVGPTALTAEDVKKHKWFNTVIFAEVCFSASKKRTIATAFLDNGARAFIGSTTEAYGRVRPVVFDGEADRLAYYFFHAYKRSGNPVRALRVAKRWLRFMSGRLDQDDEATLNSFVVITRKKFDGKQTDIKTDS